MSRPDPERLAVWRSFLQAHATITRVLEEELRDERDLPLGWYDVLVQLHEAGGRLRMHELAERLLINKSSLSRQCDRMEEAGLLLREPSPEDGRGWYAVLTREGKDLLRRSSPVHLRGVQQHFTQYLTETDVAALSRIFAKLPGSGRG
jgi:DNA-binding MarR family transcriptional regulator